MSEKYLNWDQILPVDKVHFLSKCLEQKSEDAIKER